MSILQRLKTAGFTFNKNLGQNFITDETFLATAIAPLNLTADHNIVEIGAGAGTFTRTLARTGATVTSFEIDTRLQPILGEQLRDFPNVCVVYADALAADISKHTTKPYTVVANVPYYITTPLISKFLSDPNCQAICMLVQDELARRMVAKPGGKDYGALTVQVQSAGTAQILRTVPRTLFTPQPNVDSAVLLIDKYPTSFAETDPDSTIAPRVSPVGATHFGAFLKSVFALRRKTMHNVLKKIVGDSIALPYDFLSVGIDPNARPETVTVQQFVKLFRLVHQKEEQEASAGHARSSPTDKSSHKSPCGVG